MKKILTFFIFLMLISASAVMAEEWPIDINMGDEEEPPVTPPGGGSSGGGGGGGGGSSKTTTCGDKTCDSDETCSSCPEDCGLCELLEEIPSKVSEEGETANQFSGNGEEGTRENLWEMITGAFVADGAAGSGSVAAWLVVLVILGIVIYFIASKGKKTSI